MSAQEKSIQRITEGFQRIFGKLPEFVLRSPGRINLIGEHTDYNMGFVLPAGIDKSIYFAFQKNGSDLHHLHALDKDETYEFSVSDVSKSEYLWCHFLQGGLWSLQQLGEHIGGVDLVFGSDLPIGAGLSSSSALSCGFLQGLNLLYHLRIPRFEIAMMGHKVEREYVGLKGGIMDQFANMLSKPDHFLLLDCRSKEYTHHQFVLENHALVLINTCVEHKLTESDYNVRSHESAKAAEIIHTHHKEVKSLRDVNLEMVEDLRLLLGETLFKRAAFVVKENMRVHNTIHAFTENDINTVGQNLYGSHYGLRDEYEVSCPELDFLVAQAELHPGVLGARMMGGGFGGCTINLVQKNLMSHFLQTATSAYRDTFHIDAQVVQVKLSGGTEKVDIKS